MEIFFHEAHEAYAQGPSFACTSLKALYLILYFFSLKKYPQVVRISGPLKSGPTLLITVFLGPRMVPIT